MSELRSLLVDGDASADPRLVASLVAAVSGRVERDHPVCLFAQAVIARTGDLEAADAAHRRAASAANHDPALWCAVVGSWLGIALHRQDVILLLDLRTTATEFQHSGLVAADAIVKVIDAAGAFAVADHRQVEAILAPLSGLSSIGLPRSLRGVMAAMRALSLHELGLLEASLSVIDADRLDLGVFDLTGEFIKVRYHWVSGSHATAQRLLRSAVDRALERGRQRDRDYALGCLRLLDRLHDRVPEVPRPAASAPIIATLVALEEAVALLPDEQRAAAAVAKIQSVAATPGEFRALLYVLAPHLRGAIDDETRLFVPGCLSAARELVQRRSGHLASPVAEWELLGLPSTWAQELRGVGSTEPVGTAAPRLTTPAILRTGQFIDTEVSPTAILKTLGPMAVCIAGRSVPVTRERVRLLLALLAIHRNIGRSRLISLMWPDLPPSSGANNLRTTLSYARQVLRNEPGGPPIVVSDGSTVSLGVPSDLDELNHWSTSQATLFDPVHLLELVRGRFAEDVFDAEAIEDVRRRIDGQVVDALLDASISCRTNDVRTSRQLAERALDIDEWSERAHAVLLSAWMQDRSHEQAARAVKRANAMLEDLGVDPGSHLAVVLAAWAP